MGNALVSFASGTELALNDATPELFRFRFLHELQTLHAPVGGGPELLLRDACVRPVHLEEAGPVCREVFDAHPTDEKMRPFLRACTEAGRLPCMALVGQDDTPMAIAILCAPPLPSSLAAQWMSASGASAADAFAKIYDEKWDGDGEAAAEVWTMAVGEKYVGTGALPLLLDALAEAATRSGAHTLYASAEEGDHGTAKILGTANFDALTGRAVAGRLHFRRTLGR